MLAKTQETVAADQIVDRLVDDAKKDAQKGQKSRVRYPFFRAVSIQTSGRCYSAFCREISAADIGLLHNMQLPAGEIEISITTRPSQTDKLRARIECCESCGEGWYISTAQFMDIRGARG